MDHYNPLIEDDSPLAASTAIVPSDEQNKISKPTVCCLFKLDICFVTANYSTLRNFVSCDTGSPTTVAGVAGNSAREMRVSGPKPT